MLTDMPRRCTTCGYENGPQNQFCGMCGARLSDQVQDVATSVSTVNREPSSPKGSKPSTLPDVRPAFLDISEAPAASGRLATPELPDDAVKRASYLLEEEEPTSGHGRMRVALFLLVIALGVLGWHWRQDMRTWFAGLRGTTSPVATEANPDAVPPTPSTGETTAPPASEPSPQPSPPAASHDPSTARSAGEQSAEKADTTPPQGSSSTSPPPDSAVPPSSGTTPADATAKDSDVPESNSTKNLDSSAAKTTKAEPAPDAEAAAAPPPVAKTAKPKADEGAVRASPGAALAAQGEKYLYGTGVPPDCDRAKKSLLAAAQQSNSHAESVLGTMYTTGHCVGRDLPIAYRWFAKALHGDPNNQRLTDDLESLWRQMTPGEKQFALQK